jgi:hypothetical protein
MNEIFIFLLGAIVATLGMAIIDTTQRVKKNRKNDQ